MDIIGQSGHNQTMWTYLDSMDIIVEFQCILICRGRWWWQRWNLRRWWRWRWRRRRRRTLKKRDLKGFKCMTVRLDVFGDIPRLFQYFVNDSNILWMIPIFWEKFNYFVNHFNMLWVIPSYCELLQYIVNHSHILWIFPMFGESFQCIVNYSNILWIIPIFCEFIKWLNCS